MATSLATRQNTTPPSGGGERKTTCATAGFLKTSRSKKSTIQQLSAAGSFTSRGRSNYLEPKARLEAIWVVVFPAVVYIASVTRAATNRDSSAPYSSLLAAHYGLAGNSTAPGRDQGASSIRSAVSSTPGRRLADVTGTPGKEKCMEMQKTAP